MNLSPPKAEVVKTSITSTALIIEPQVAKKDTPKAAPKSESKEVKEVEKTTEVVKRKLDLSAAEPKFLKPEQKSKPSLLEKIKEKAKTASPLQKRDTEPKAATLQKIEKPKAAPPEKKPQMVVKRSTPVKKSVDKTPKEKKIVPKAKASSASAKKNSIKRPAPKQKKKEVPKKVTKSAEKKKPQLKKKPEKRKSTSRKAPVKKRKPARRKTGTKAKKKNSESSSSSSASTSTTAETSEESSSVFSEEPKPIPRKRKASPVKSARKKRKKRSKSITVETPQGSWTIGGIQNSMEEMFDMTGSSPFASNTSPMQTSITMESKISEILSEVLQPEILAGRVEGERIIAYGQSLQWEEYFLVRDLHKFIDVEQLVTMKFKRKHANMIMNKVKQIAKR